ncbi:39S ribosomal protein L53 [Sarcoptes scabiei]|nr:39S ribosomal protein L53 [Sarcoptes scabiei]
MVPPNQIKEKLNITPERQEAFIHFVRSLPKICSPTLFFGDQNDGNKDPESKSHNFSQSLFDYSADTNMDNFRWSIDEYAMVYGQDFPNEHELEYFHSLIHSKMSQELDQENEGYFSQEKILPSPNHIRLPKSDANLKFDKIDLHQNSSRTTESFLQFLDALPTNHLDIDNNDFENENNLNSAKENDVSMRSDILEEEFHSKIDDSTKPMADSDFVSMSNDEEMELSLLNYSQRPRISSAFTPKLRHCDFGNGKLNLIGNFIDDISPIVNYNKQIDSLKNDEQRFPFGNELQSKCMKNFEKKQSIANHLDQKEFSPILNDSSNCFYIRKRAFIDQSLSVRRRSPQIKNNFDSSESRKITHSRESFLIESASSSMFRDRTNTSYDESVRLAQTPQSASILRSRPRSLRCNKLLFSNEFASTPNSMLN